MRDLTITINCKNIIKSSIALHMFLNIHISKILQNLDLVTSNSIQKHCNNQTSIAKHTHDVN